MLVTTSPSSPPTLREKPRPTPSLVSPLLPVVLPLVVVAIGLSAVLARWSPTRILGPSPRLRWSEGTAAAGLRFDHRQGGEWGPTALGGAVVVFDFDQDERPDLFFVNGAPWPWEENLKKRIGRTGALFRNLGQGRFADHTAAAGLGVELQGMAAAAGDFDNDGRPDLMVTGVGTHHLFRNLGQGRFEDVSEAKGIRTDDPTWGSGVVWIDCDDDGWLDLVIVNYVRWSRDMGWEAALATARNGLSYGAPVGFVSALPTVYRNLGGERFVLLTDSAGLRDIDPETRRPVRFPLAVIPVDANGDASLDLLITYQERGPTLYLSRGGRFERQTAGRERFQEGSSAGLASASGVAFTPIQTDSRSRDLIALATQAVTPTPGDGIELVTRLAGAMADFDFDGREEWATAGGMAADRLFTAGAKAGESMPPHLRWWDGVKWGSRLMIDSQGLRWSSTAATRGVAAVDVEGDGDLDLVFAQNEVSPMVLINELRGETPWLRFRLVATRSHPEAAGARVEVHTPRRILSRTVAPAMSYLAQSESTLTFGLGDDARVRKVVIHWPSGQRQELRSLTLNRSVVIREP